MEVESGVEDVIRSEYVSGRKQTLSKNLLNTENTKLGN